MTNSSPAQKCIVKFNQTYGRDPDAISFCPYRICPIGAHSDHNMGKITGLVIDKGIHIAYASKHNGVIELSSLQFSKRAQWYVASVPDTTVVNDGTRTKETRLGAVRDIKFAIDRLELDDDLLVIAGDNVLDFSLTQFIRYAQDKQASCIMRYREDDVQKLKKCGVVEIDETDRILSMEEKPQQPESHWCCPPFYNYIQEDCRRIPEAIASGCGTDAPGSLVAWLSDVSTVYAMEMPGKRYDVGNQAGYEKIKAEYKGITGKVREE